jgi:probable addiction module antidote protein
MPETIKVSDLPEFDMAEHLEDGQAIAEYLTLVIEDGDAAELARALGHVARSRGMSEVARESGLAREALYKALRADSAPRFDTIQRVLHALGLQLTVRAA